MLMRVLRSYYVLVAYLKGVRGGLCGEMICLLLSTVVLLPFFGISECP